MDSKRHLARIRWEVLAKQIGSRYADCTLEGFECGLPKQREAVASLQRFIDAMPGNIQAGAGVFLYGPVGTGKDHLLSALMRAATQRGAYVRWLNGLDLFGAIRDLMSSRGDEANFIEQYTTVGVLAISDPFSGRSELTPHQIDMLSRIIDGRYRTNRATWITANLTDRKDAEKRLGIPITDRLGHGSLSVHCNWPSYRRAGA